MATQLKVLITIHYRSNKFAQQQKPKEYRLTLISRDSDSSRMVTHLKLPKVWLGKYWPEKLLVLLLT